MEIGKLIKKYEKMSDLNRYLFRIIILNENDNDSFILHRSSDLAQRIDKILIDEIREKEDNTVELVENIVKKRRGKPRKESIPE